jgi:hypothetical protein
MKTSKWIIGEDAECKNEYLIHAHRPRFIALMKDSEVPVGGLIFGDYEWEIVSVLWIDKRPPSDLADALIAEGLCAGRAYDRKCAMLGSLSEAANEDDDWDDDNYWDDDRDEQEK